MSHEISLPTPATESRFGLSLPAKRLLLLTAVAALVIFIFMTIDAKGSWSFLLSFRGTKVAAMMLVGYAIAVSTVLFQTITNNRILTPSVMGFDALYVLLQTTLVFTIGAHQWVTYDSKIRFVLEIVLMVAFSGLLYRTLFTRNRRSLHLLLLVGLVIGVFFRSISGFMTRLIDPNEFVILQDMLFASFNSFDRELLGAAAIIMGLMTLIIWRIRHRFDVLSLGRETAINLGVDYQRTVTIVLAVTSVFVSVSTALVGPVTFFGLLVANLAYQVAGSHRHVWILPSAALMALIFLLGGQMVVERVFAFNTSLSIIVEFLGGVMFIFLLLRGAAR